MECRNVGRWAVLAVSLLLLAVAPLAVAHTTVSGLKLRLNPNYSDQLAVSPTQGPPGTQVTLKGTDWDPKLLGNGGSNTTGLEIYYANSKTDSSADTTYSKDTGVSTGIGSPGCDPCSFTVNASVPSDAPQGTGYFLAMTAAAPAAEAEVTVTQAAPPPSNTCPKDYYVADTPQSGPPGAEVTLTGCGWPAKVLPIEIDYSGAKVAYDKNVGSTGTGPAGCGPCGFTVTVTVPTDAPQGPGEFDLINPSNSPWAYADFAVTSGGGGSGGGGGNPGGDNPGKPTKPLAAPSGLSAKAINLTTVRLRWKDNSTNESGFEVRRNGGSTLGTPANRTTVDWKALKPNTKYCFKVHPLPPGRFGSPPPSDWSNNACATTPEPMRDDSALLHKADKWLLNIGTAAWMEALKRCVKDPPKKGCGAILTKDKVIAQTVAKRVKPLLKKLGPIGIFVKAVHLVELGAADGHLLGSEIRLRHLLDKYCSQKDSCLYGVPKEVNAQLRTVDSDAKAAKEALISFLDDFTIAPVDSIIDPLLP